MTKYKLIKKLPFEGSPEIGYISEPSNERDSTHYLCYNWFQPKDYPEYWEEVVEKDYEILSFIDDESNIWHDVSNWKLNAYLTIKIYKIYSIKRLSDGEIFTIGDKVTSTLRIGEEEFFISSFKTASEGSKTIYICGHQISTLLYSTMKLKKLFITEDGIDIFEGDKYWYVNFSGVPPFYYPKCHTTGFADRGLSPLGAKHFSTKEKAEKWIFRNKPCLSLKDIETFDDWSYYYIKVNRESLKELVKSKL